MDDDLVRQQNERLLLAAKNGNLSVVNDALEHGALINTEDTVPLCVPRSFGRGRALQPESGLSRACTEPRWPPRASALRSR